MQWISELSPVQQAFLATMFTWGVTALGASLVFFFKTINKRVLNGMLGFAAGVMIAASFWSLLAPAIEMAEELGQVPYITAAVGFLGGGLFLYIVDKVLPHLHMGQETSKADGIKTNWQRSILLVLSITLHNIPEGLAVGVAFGAIASGTGTSATLAGAVALAIGIGLQNFPEGAAVSIPLRREGLSRRKAFLYGQASGIVEPIAGVIGAYTVVKMQHILPYALAFAAGAMIYVVVKELIPESQREEGSSSSHVATIGCMVGFAIMMILDVSLG
ncbi:MAG: ZIP family metal transporter [Clostridium sp.]